MQQVYNNVIYDTDTGILLARKASRTLVKAGGLMEEMDESIELYRTPNNAYFKYVVPKGPKGRTVGKITPLKPDEAMAEYNKLPTRILEPKEAFPDIELKEA
jgi:hypothetical protein